jgi:hypothetical protein
MPLAASLEKGKPPDLGNRSGSQQKVRHMNILNMPGPSNQDGATDPFDPSALRLNQSFADGPAIKKLLTTIPVRKPGAQDFIRVHPNAEYRLDTAVISLKDDRETYLVAPTLVPELITECVPVTLFTTMSRQGVLSLWPVRLPGPDGKMNEWWRSARDAAEIAMESWARVKASTSLGAYEIFHAAAAIPDPEWPDLSFREILKIAFRDHYIDTLDHAVIKRLRGQM